MDDPSPSGEQIILSEPPAEGLFEAPPLTAPAIVSLRLPTWKIVLLLAWPVLAQQFLIQVVGLSDSFLAGNFRAVSPQEETVAAGQRLMALGQLGGGWTAGAGPTAGLTALVSWEPGDRIMARQIAFQSAQTTAISPGSSAA